MPRGSEHWHSVSGWPLQTVSATDFDHLYLPFPEVVQGSHLKFTGAT